MQKNRKDSVTEWPTYVGESFHDSILFRRGNKAQITSPSPRSQVHTYRFFRSSANHNL